LLRCLRRFGILNASRAVSLQRESGFMSTREHTRLQQIQDDIRGWRRWGPYVGDRSWATVREDYSSDGNAWAYLPHDLARSKAYRWGEDGIAGLCDRYQLLVFAPAFWNGNDPILKERLFGVTPIEGNHGEDVKEYYFHLDNTPTHSYMKFLYKYPQAEFPYGLLTEENRRRGGQGSEYELLDTGVFDQDRYFDIVIEYAKVDEEDIAIRIEAFNRGPAAAPLHILTHLWHRNTWSWTPTPGPEPSIRLGPPAADVLSLVSDDSAVETLSNIPVFYRLGQRTLYAPGGGAPLFTNNETHCERVFGPGSFSRTPFVKDAFHRYIIRGETRRRPAPRRRYTIASTCPWAARRCCGFASPTRATWPSRSPRSMPSSVGGDRRPMSSTPRSTPRRRTRTNAASSARPCRVCCGPSKATSSTCSAGLRATSPTVRRQPTGLRSAISTGATSTRCGS
jgi:hypothetical protein